MTMRVAAVLLIPFVFLAGCGDGGGKPDAPSKTPAAGHGLGAGGGAEATVELGADWRAKAASAAGKGADFLLGAAEDGKWRFAPGKGDPDLGISALATTAILARRPGDEGLKSTRTALEWLASSQKPDGGIYDKSVAVYVTSIAVLALKASGDPKYQAVLAKAVEYLRIVQTDESDQRDRSSEDYGGVGYGGKGDVNLSTTHFAIEAASAAGLPKDDDFYKKALVFLERTQNRSESNPLVHQQPDGSTVEAGNDGGAFYRPAESKGGIATLPDGRKVFKSYGSMTYALLKSYLLCDLDAKDPRVKAALDWISKNWVLEHNPGLEDPAKPEAKYQGLYYYYLTLARCLSAAEAQRVDLAALGLGRWRQELAAVLLAKQLPDGSWTNPTERWMEASPVLATSYAVIALHECAGTP